MSINSFPEILNKMQSFCAYRERCKYEVRQKLIEYNLPVSLNDQLMELLEKENFINEDRFALEFACGKFRIKKWGRQKIKFELLKKEVEQKLIVKAIGAIDEEEYILTLKVMLEKKMNTILFKKNVQEAKIKVSRYAMAKGYESDLVWDILNKIEITEKK